MKSKQYRVDKNKKVNQNITISKKRIDGYKITPKNNIDYNGIEVNSLLIVKPMLIEKLLKKKIKRRLEYYLKYILESIDGEDDSAFRGALDDLERFKGIVEYKYRKFLDDKYINLLNKKITLLEHEIKNKIIYREQLNNYSRAYANDDLEKEERKRRK